MAATGGNRSDSPLLESSSDSIAGMLTEFTKIVKFYSAAQVVISAVFWAWALANILRRGGFDAGVVSFVFPFFAGICGFISTIKETKRDRVFYANIHIGLTIFGHFLVTLNYLAGCLIPGLPLGFIIYCAIFTVLWAISGGLCGYASIKWKRLLKAHHSSHF